MSQIDKGRASRTFVHDFGPARFTLQQPVEVELRFMLNRSPAGLDRDREIFTVLVESVQAWQGVPLSWLTLDPADDGTPLDFSAEAKADLLRNRVDILDSINEALATFIAKRRELMEAQRKNFGTTSPA